MDHLIVFDVESAGLKLEEGLVEQAWLEIDDDMNVINEVRSLICPPGPIDPSASGVHGLIYDDVKDAPSIEQFWDSMGNCFANKRVLMIAHNAQFDAKYLAPYVGQLHQLCTLKLSRIAFPSDCEGQPAGYVPPPNHKQATMLFYLGLVRKGTHNALDDVFTCLQLLQKIGEKLDMTLEEMYELANTPVRVKKIGFGKHKGTKVTDLPSGYVTWLLKQDNVDPNLRWTLENPL